MNKKNLTISILILGGLILLISALHFLTPVDSIILHQIYQRLYYIPIILASFWYGWRGGLGAALLASVSYLPHIALPQTARYLGITRSALIYRMQKFGFDE